MNNNSHVLRMTIKKCVLLKKMSLFTPLKSFEIKMGPEEDISKLVSKFVFLTQSFACARLKISIRQNRSSAVSPARLWIWITGSQVSQAQQDSLVVVKVVAFLSLPND